MRCPRDAEGKFNATWERDACTYCGSYSPGKFIEAVERGCKVIPTDKNYKAYVEVENPYAGRPAVFGTANHNPGGLYVQMSADEFAQLRYEDGRPVVPMRESSMWVMLRPAASVIDKKFYFQHLSREQQQLFVDLYNDKKMNIGEPGNFYVMPYFATIGVKKESE